MKHKFKIGDEVVVYLYTRGYKGFIESVNKDNTLKVIFTTGSNGNYHYKQCRRLIKQEKHVIDNIEWKQNSLGLTYPCGVDLYCPSINDPFKQFIGKKTKVIVKVYK